MRLEKQQSMDDDKRVGFPGIREAEKIFEASAKTDVDYKTFEAAIIRHCAQVTRRIAILDGNDPDTTPVHEGVFFRGEVYDWRQRYAQQKPEPA